jgi:hypothetical protein
MVERHLSSGLAWMVLILCVVTSIVLSCGAALSLGELNETVRQLELPPSHAGDKEVAEAYRLVAKTTRSLTAVCVLSLVLSMYMGIREIRLKRELRVRGQHAPPPPNDEGSPRH